MSCLFDCPRQRYTLATVCASFFVVTHLAQINRCCLFVLPSSPPKGGIMNSSMTSPRPSTSIAPHRLTTHSFCVDHSAQTSALSDIDQFALSGHTSLGSKLAYCRPSWDRALRGSLRFFTTPRSCFRTTFGSSMVPPEVCAVLGLLSLLHWASLVSCPRLRLRRSFFDYAPPTFSCG